MASLISPQLHELVTYVRSRSPYYQLLYANLPTEVDNFESLPFVDNILYWKSSNTEPNGVITEPLTDAVIMRSGGSTSEPKTVYMTRGEFLETSRISGELFGRCCGIRPGDRVANLSSQGGMYSGFMTYGYTVMNCSLPVVNLPISGKEPHENIERDILQFKATVIISNVFIATKLAHYLRNKRAQLPSVRLILYTGGPFYKDLRPLYKCAFPNVVIRPLAYASVECKIVAFPEYELNHENEDGDINPVYRTCDRSVFLEIIAEDGSVVKVNGIRGSLVVTNLLKRLQPTIRYPIGDVGEWVNVQSGLFRLKGRSNVGLKIGTALLDKELIRKLVIQVVGAGVADSFQTVIRRKDSYNIVLFRIAAQAAMDTDSIPQRLEEAIVNANPSWATNRDAGQIAPIEVEWVQFEDLVFLEASGKLREVIDERF